MPITVDVSTLSGWNDLASGTYSITIKAKKTNNINSNASTGVSVTKAPSGYQVTVQAGDGNYAYYIHDGENLIYTIDYDEDPHIVTITSGEMRISTNAGSWIDNGTISGGVSVISYDESYGCLYSITADGSVVGFYGFCLSGDTLVTMADYSTKRLDEIDVGDYILSFNWNTMQLVPNKVIQTDKNSHKSFNKYDIWTFDDGTEIKTIHRHEFYNVEAKCFKYMDEWNIGEHTYKIDGTTPTLIKHEVVNEEINHYKITGGLGTNYFANGLLTGDRNCPKNIIFSKEE